MSDDIKYLDGVEMNMSTQTFKVTKPMTRVELYKKLKELWYVDPEDLIFD